MKTKLVKLKNLHQDTLNANRGTVRGSAMVEHSIRNYGAGRSVLVDSQNRIIAGNKTVAASLDAGMDEEAILLETDGRRLVVVKRTDVSIDSPEGRGLAIADNRASEVGLEWDLDALSEISEELDLNQFWFEGEIEIPELSLDELGEDYGLTDPEEMPDVEGEATTKRGDVWILGNHRVMCGDSTSADDVARLMGGELADALITDPPYGVSYADKNAFLNSYGERTGNRYGNVSIVNQIENDHLSVENIGPFWKSVFSLMFEHTKKGGTYYMTGPQGGDLSMMMMMMQESGWLLKHVLIWVKNNHVFGRCDYNYKHEPILYGWKPGAGHYFGGSGSDTSVWNFDRPEFSKLHPTMKPVKLIAHAAERALKRGEIVLDPFLGSGTSVIAAEQTGRRCYGLEISEHYCDVIVKRWEEFTGKKAQLEGADK